MTGATTHSQAPRYAPHPYVGGRATVLRALADWRAQRPGAPRVVLLTGSAGSGRSHLLTGFLMVCDPEFRGRIELEKLDPSTVPPPLPAPAVPDARGLTAAQLTWLIAAHYGLDADRPEDVYAELAALNNPVTVVVPDVDRAGPLRSAGEPAKVVREVLEPLARTERVWLLADVPREFAAPFAEGLPPGTVQIIDLDEPQWADPEGPLLQAEALLAAEGPLGQPQQPGAPKPSFTTDPTARRTLATAIARRAGSAGASPLVVQLAVNSIRTATSAAPTEGEEGGEGQLPASIDECLDLHARRLGADPLTLRQLLTPLALAEGDGMPVEIWARLVNTVAGRDMSAAIAGAPALAGPFVESLQDGDSLHDGDGEGAGAGGRKDGAGGRTLLRLVHPAIRDTIRDGLDNARTTQAQLAMALLEAVPEQDWGKADPYVRDYIAGHTLEAGLLPQLLTDPGLFVHAHPVPLRAAVEAVPPQQLGAPGRTYLRTAPLLTRTQAPTTARAALLESAFVEDGLADYGAAVHRLGIALPWQTLWSVSLPGITDVRFAGLSSADAPPVLVATFTVPGDTPGAIRLGSDGGSALLVYDLARAAAVPVPGPEYLVHYAEEHRSAGPYRLTRGADQLRVWDRANNTVAASLISATPFTGADLSPDGLLVVSTQHGAKALRLLG